MTILIGSAVKSTRERWKQILGEDYRIIEASSGAEVQSALGREPVVLVLLHRSMVALEFFAGLKNQRVLVFSDLPEDNEAYTLLKMGAFGYANTYMSPARLREAVRVALSGRVWVGQKLMQKIISGTTRSLLAENTDSPPDHNLSEREWEVALLVSKGRSNLEIAAELDITERTVKAHIGSIFKKTKTVSRLQLALHVKGLLAGKQASPTIG